MRRELVESYARLEEWHWWFRGRQRILEAVLARALSGRRSLAIASLGCGPPDGLRWLEPFARDGRVVGVDVERCYARGRDPRVEQVVGRLEALPLAAGAFDVVLALDVLEHLDDDAAGLREAARLARPGGWLLVTVPALPGLWGSQDVISHHRRRYTRGTLLRTFARAQLPVPRATYFNTLLLAPVAGVRLARRWIGLAERARSDFDDARPGLLNDLLSVVFAAERHLVPRLRLPIGVSLLATLRMDPDAAG